MYAVIEAGGKQFKVEKDSIIHVPKMDLDVGDRIEFDSVLLFANGEQIAVGSPHVSKTKVLASVISHQKDDKITVFKMKRRKGYRRKRGHRQDFTELLIHDIVTDS